MVKRFRLPNASFSSEYFVYPVGRSTLDGIHNFCQRINLHGLPVNQRREDHVNMIRHHNSDTEIEFHPVIVKAALQHNRTCPIRKHPPPVSAECYKMLPVIALKMRKLSAIESLRHRFYVGTAAPGCPRSEAPLCLKSIRSGGALGIASCKNSCPISDRENWRGNPGERARPDSRGRLSPHDHCQRPPSEITLIFFILRPTRRVMN